MHQSLNEFLEQEICFYSLQFGFHLNSSTNNALTSTIKDIQTQMIVNMLQGFLIIWKKLLIQLAIICSLKNWIMIVAKDKFKMLPGIMIVAKDKFKMLPGIMIVAKDKFEMLPGVEETIFCYWKWNINNQINL